MPLLRIAAVSVLLVTARFYSSYDDAMYYELREMVGYSSVCRTLRNAARTARDSRWQWTSRDPGASVGDAPQHNSDPDRLSSSFGPTTDSERCDARLGTHPDETTEAPA